MLARWHANTHAECSVMGLKHALPACSFGPRLVVACAHSFGCMVGVAGAPWDREQKNLKKKSYGLNEKGTIISVHSPVYCNPDSVLFQLDYENINL